MSACASQPSHSRLRTSGSACVIRPFSVMAILSAPTETEIAASCRLVADGKIPRSRPQQGLRLETEPRRGIYNDTTAWRYHFEPIADCATRVSDVLQAPWWIRAMDTLHGQPKALHTGMRRALANLKRIAETSHGPPSTKIGSR
jgi:hypothetical protein